MEMEQEILTEPLTEPAVERADPRPGAAPKPSYAPFLVALGITMAFWGLATSPVMSAGGFVVFAWGLGSWLRDVARSWRNSHAPET
jgi:hypothetical protein